MGELDWEIVPEGCDCCGHDAEDCGMLGRGWVTDSQLLAGGGTYCKPCAHLLRIARLASTAPGARRRWSTRDGRGATGWAYFADELGELHPCCPGCLAERFGIAEPVPAPRRALRRRPGSARLALDARRN